LLAEAAAQEQVLAVGGFEGALQFGDLLAVAAFEVGELAGERGDHVTGLAGAGVVVLRVAGLLAAELLDPCRMEGVR